jgi:hypothetical protein
MQIAKRRGMKKAIVAPARRLAVIMHRSGLTAPRFAGPRADIEPYGPAMADTVLKSRVIPCGG